MDTDIERRAKYGHVVYLQPHIDVKKKRTIVAQQNFDYVIVHVMTRKFVFISTYLIFRWK